MIPWLNKSSLLERMLEEFPVPNRSSCDVFPDHPLHALDGDDHAGDIILRSSFSGTANNGLAGVYGLLSFDLVGELLVSHSVRNL